MDFNDALPSVLAAIANTRPLPPVGFLRESPRAGYGTTQSVIDFDFMVIRWLDLETVLHKQHRFLRNI
jgi:hypothetical protein